MLVVFFLFALDRFPLFQDRAGIARIALAKNVWMPPDQFIGDLRDHVVDLELTGFTRDLSVHDHEKQKIAEFFPKMRLVLSVSSFGNFIGFLDRRWQKRFVGLFPVPRTPARRAQFGDSVAQLLERW